MQTWTFMDSFSRFEDYTNACRIPYSVRQRTLVMRLDKYARRFATQVQYRLGNNYEEMVRALGREFSPMSNQKYLSDLPHSTMNPVEGILS